jgi:fimbrial chaperone protein
MRHLLGLLLCMLPVLARASSLDVDPIRVTFSAQKSVTVLTLTNAGDEPATVQLEPVAWSQDKGEDKYVPTRDLLATPPIFTVPAKGKQIIRLGLRVPPNAQREMSYRLYLQEVPQANKAGGLGVVMALRIGVPVFVVPVAPVKPALQWKARRVSDTQMELSAMNGGTAHIQLRQITVAGADKAPLLIQQACYILPGTSHVWALKLVHPLAAGTTLQLDYDSDVGPLHEKLVLE